jgi:glycosyltransferase involved in cell wall biosynthesis
MPKISVITPLHKPGNAYIQETYESLLIQSFQDWEWIILENHGGLVPENIRADTRVKIYNFDINGIGALKAFLCKRATTDYIVELDNDDILIETALEEVLAAFEDGADFVYSDSAEFQDKTWANESEGYPYSSVFGWSYYPIVYKGLVTLYAMRSPELNAQNIRRIEWSPNHVRAWTRKSYNEIGGHDVSMVVADDHDLMVRYFLAGKKFKHIEECLYLYRVHADNTVKTNNANIQRATHQVYGKYIWKLGEKFADDNGLSKVDLCGGVNPVPGYLSLDEQIKPGIISCDLNYDWPLKNNSVGIIRANDAVEHLIDPVHTMNECYRILAPGGFLMIDVPSTNGLGAFCDPTHKSFWNRLSFRYYCEGVFKQYVPKFNGRFQVMHLVEWFPSEQHRIDNVPYVQAQLLALKDGYHPMGAVYC